MSMYSGNKINRCRPGHNASCSLCCGSHNYTMPSEEIEDMLRRRGRELNRSATYHPETAGAEKLFRDELQCRMVGMLPDDPSAVCCMVYDDHERSAEIGSFFSGTCKNFLCPAWHELTDRQVEFAARLMGDWYYYSLLINHIEAVHELCAAYEAPEDVPLDELQSLKEDLYERFIEEDGK